MRVNMKDEGLIQIGHGWLSVEVKSCHIEKIESPSFNHFLDRGLCFY